MRNLLRRSLSGIIYVLIFVSAILFSKESYIALVTFFAIIAIYELAKITKFKSIISYILFGLALFLMLKRPNSYAIKIEKKKKKEAETEMNIKLANRLTKSDEQV